MASGANRTGDGVEPLSANQWPESIARGNGALAALTFAAFIGVVALAALGTCWAIDRLHARETPRWDPASVVELRQAPGGPENWSERWVVAVHPGCSHCRASLGRLAAARDQNGADIRIVALLVDQSSRPPDSLVKRLPADEVCWDAADRWRGRWGHRVYGETFCFAPDGHLLRLLAPFARFEDAAEELRDLGNVSPL